MTRVCSRICWATMLAGCMTLPVLAQDEAPAADEGVAEPATAEEAAPTDTTPAEEVLTTGETIDEAGGEAADGAAAAEDGGAGDTQPAEEVATEDTSGEETAESEEPVDEGGDLALYLGAEYVDLRVDLSDEPMQAEFGRDEFDAQMYVLRAGIRMFEFIAFELQGGAGGSASGSDELEVKQYLGAYFAPTGTIAEMVEISVRVGYSFMTLESENGSEEDFDGVSYGVGVELPLRAFGESLPNLRIVGGGSVYQSDRDSRTFGWRAGLRYDFRI